jgi:hypothetical protein
LTVNKECVLGRSARESSATQQQQEINKQNGRQNELFSPHIALIAFFNRLMISCQGRMTKRRWNIMKMMTKTTYPDGNKRETHQSVREEQQQTKTHFLDSTPIWSMV